MWTSYLLQRNELEDEVWNDFVAASPQQYLYYYTWYLDAACPGWHAIVVEENGRWVAVMPLPLRKKGGVMYAFQPPLTQFLGIIFCPAPMVRHSYYGFLKNATQKAIEALPPMAAFDMNLHPEIDYFLPFFWNKFTVQARFTYLLPLDGDFQSLQKNFSHNVARAVKKSQKNSVAVSLASDETILLGLLRKEGIFDEMYGAAFTRVWKEIRRRGNGFILHATDPEGKVFSAVAFILDGERAILYASVSDRDRKSSGANALVVSEAIRRCCEYDGIRWLDCEGSMLEGVEQYFRSFNPVAKVYLNVKRLKYPLLYKLYRKLT